MESNITKNIETKGLIVMLLKNETVTAKDEKELSLFVVKNNDKLFEVLGYNVQHYIREQALVDSMNHVKENVAIKASGGEQIIGFYSYRFITDLLFPNKDRDDMKAFELSNFCKNEVFEEFLDEDFSEKVFKMHIMPNLRLTAENCRAKIVYVIVPLETKLFELFEHLGFNIPEGGELRRIINLGNGFPPKTAFMYKEL